LLPLLPFFFFLSALTTHISPLSLHDALPILNSSASETCSGTKSLKRFSVSLIVSSAALGTNSSYLTKTFFIISPDSIILDIPLVGFLFVLLIFNFYRMCLVLTFFVFLLFLLFYNISCVFGNTLSL